MRKGFLLNPLSSTFPVWNRFSDFGVVVRPGQESATKDRQYLKGMIRSLIYAKNGNPWISFRGRTNNSNNCHIAVLYHSLVRRARNEHKILL